MRFSQGACILTGLGFNGYDPATGRTMWDRVKNVDIIAIETSSSFKILFDSWNCRTNVSITELCKVGGHSDRIFYAGLAQRHGVQESHS